MFREEYDIETNNTNICPLLVKLIYNPVAGANNGSSEQLMGVIKEMQSLNIMPEPFLIEPGCDLSLVVQDAIVQGIHMFVVCGGDGTISAVYKAMIGTNATLGIIPTGTQNNIALSLGIPTDIPAAIAILRSGISMKIDIGIVTCGGISTHFLEVCSVGLFSTLFPSGDDIQHGKITRIGDFLATLTASQPSEMHILLDDEQEIRRNGHIVLISNMPYIGRHYQVGSEDSFNDGLLDVLFSADLSKLDLIGCILPGTGTSTFEDPRIQRFRVRKVVIDTNPPMSVMADGISLGEGAVQIEVRPQALAVMLASKAPNKLKELGENLEK